MIIYNIYTGKVSKLVICSSNQEHCQKIEANEARIDGSEVNPKTQYVQNGVLVDRPEFSIDISKTEILAYEREATVLSSIPIGTIIAIEGVEYEVDDGVFELTVEIPATYTLTIINFPYITQEVTIEGKP